MTKHELAIEVTNVEVGRTGDLEWSERMREQRAGSLTAVRAIAERWIAILTAILGFAGAASLLQGPVAFEKLGSTTMAFAKGGAFGAAVLALVALGCATVAGQYASRESFLPTTGAIQEEFDEALERTVEWLFWSRVLAIGAIALAILGAALLWWSPAETPSPQRIEVLGWPPKR